MSADQIVKKVLLKAARSRVWRAITEPSQFGSWFGMKFEGAVFAPGSRVDAEIAATTVDEDIAKLQRAHAGMKFELLIDRVEPERVFSFRWHPYAVDKSIDYAAEPTTLVEFALEEQAGGVLLTVTESGFEGLPAERRAKAFAANEGGWAMQMKLVEKYLAQAG